MEETRTTAALREAYSARPLAELSRLLDEATKTHDSEMAGILRPLVTARMDRLMSAPDLGADDIADIQFAVGSEEERGAFAAAGMLKTRWLAATKR